MAQRACPQCGSLYEVTAEKIPQRDSDSIECTVCGAALMSWDGSTQYYKRLLRANPWPRTAPEAKT